jgi:hypothetical protein
MQNFISLMFSILTRKKQFPTFFLGRLIRHVLGVNGFRLVDRETVIVDPQHSGVLREVEVRRWTLEQSLPRAEHHSKKSIAVKHATLGSTCNGTRLRINITRNIKAALSPEQSSSVQTQCYLTPSRIYAYLQEKWPQSERF